MAVGESATSNGADVRELSSGEPSEFRLEVTRCCAWCLRLWANGEWILGRRGTDGAEPAEATHTICDDCDQRVRLDGLSGSVS